VADDVKNLYRSVRMTKMPLKDFEALPEFMGF